jgi:hypothetical protein
LGGEPWDFMGSRRLMYDMYRNTTATVGSGFDLAHVDEVR